MERTDKYTSSGRYSPTFFKIQLITEDNIEDLFKDGISERGEASFLHEYIHLLQLFCGFHPLGRGFLQI